MSNAVSIWGNVPTWISAIFSSASFTVAAAVYAKNRQDKIREQAAKVTVHAVENVGHVRNDSNLPIFQLSLLLKRGPEKDPPFIRGLWRIQLTHSRAMCSVRRLGPNEVLRVGMPPGMPEGSTIVAIEFADADGRHWMREDTGRLQRVVAPWKPPLNLGGQVVLQEAAPTYSPDIDGPSEPVPNQQAGNPK
ncbi:hypothetical protein [Streptomyces sp. N2A]|uniref:hypothetical protein n=1 Tax=Streptomyces sp. N2A TaxID=3073936 RepID=UPI00286FEF1C|nr:hypothetical protein [Streptomyces sp. N2A]